MKVNQIKPEAFRKWKYAAISKRNDCVDGKISVQDLTDWMEAYFPKRQKNNDHYSVFSKPISLIMRTNIIYAAMEQAEYPDGPVLSFSLALSDSERHFIWGYMRGFINAAIK